MLPEAYIVSIPMTVLGGLQFALLIALISKMTSFNTDDGIRRAAIFQSGTQRPLQLSFQYR